MYGQRYENNEATRNADNNVHEKFIVQPSARLVRVGGNDPRAAAAVTRVAVNA